MFLSPDWPTLASYPLTPPSLCSSVAFLPRLFAPILSFLVQMEKLGSVEPAHPLPDAEPAAGAAKMEGALGDEGATLASSKLFWCECMRRWLPPAYREELYHVLRLTGPLVSGGQLKHCFERALVGIIQSNSATPCEI